MSVIAFDTSALVRRYDRREPGSDRVRALCAPAVGNTLVIARITAIELASALARKGRDRVLDPVDRDQIWQLFQEHYRADYQVVEATDMIYLHAERLVFRYPLRAYDAMHLASALVVADTLRELASDFLFCTSDRMQASTASAEGLTTELIA